MLEKLLVSDDLARSCENLIKQGGLFKSEKQAAFIISKTLHSKDFAPTDIMMDYESADGVIASDAWNKNNVEFRYYYVVDKKGVVAKILGVSNFSQASKSKEQQLANKYNVNITDEGVFYKEGPRVNESLRKEISNQLKNTVKEKFTTKWERNTIMSSININEIRKKIAKNLNIKAEDENSVELKTQQITKIADNFIRFIMGDKEQALKNLKILKIDYSMPDEEQYNKDYEKAFKNMVVFLKKHFN